MFRPTGTTSTPRHRTAQRWPALDGIPYHRSAPLDRQLTTASRHPHLSTPRPHHYNDRPRRQLAATAVPNHNITRRHSSPASRTSPLRHLDASGHRRASHVRPHLDGTIIPGQPHNTPSTPAHRATTVDTSPLTPQQSSQRITLRHCRTGQAHYSATQHLDAHQSPADHDLDARTTQVTTRRHYTPVHYSSPVRVITSHHSPSDQDQPRHRTTRRQDKPAHRTARHCSTRRHHTTQHGAQLDDKPIHDIEPRRHRMAPHPTASQPTAQLDATPHHYTPEHNSPDLDTISSHGMTSHDSTPFQVTSEQHSTPAQPRPVSHQPSTPSQPRGNASQPSPPAHDRARHRTTRRQIVSAGSSPAGRLIVLDLRLQDDLRVIDLQLRH